MPFVSKARAAGQPSLELRLARGISWSAAGAVISSGLAFAASFPVARILGQSAFGELAIIQSTVGLFATFAGFGLGIATTKFVAEFREEAPARAVRVITFLLAFSALTGGLGCAALFAISPWLAETTLAAAHLAPAMRVGSILLLIGAIDGVLIGGLAGWEAFRSITLASFAKGLCAFPCLVGGAYLGGLEGIAWGMVVTALVGALVSGILVGKQLRPMLSRDSRLLGCLEEWRVIAHFALPVLVSTGVFAAGEWTANAILANQDNGYAELGIFTAANRIFAALLLVSSLLNKPLVPVVSEQIGSAATGQAARVVRLTMKMNAVVILPLVLLAAIFSPLVMTLFGPEFVRGWPTLIVVLVTAGIVAVLAPIGHWIVASDRAWVNALQYSVWAATFVSLTYLLVPWGALGLVIARAAAYSLHGAIVMLFASRHIFAADRLSARRDVHLRVTRFFRWTRRSV